MRRRGVCPGIPQQLETRPLFSDRPYDIKEVTYGRPTDMRRVLVYSGLEKLFL